jgi:hypothetical protein
LLSLDLWRYLRLGILRHFRIQGAPNFGRHPQFGQARVECRSEYSDDSAPRSAIASMPAIREMALLMPDAVPACWLSAALMTVVVSGATLTAMPRPSTAIAGKNVVQ